MVSKFKLTDAFISRYEGKEPDWGFNGLAELTFRRTYSTRNNKVEEWWEVCRRVVEGCYNIQKHHIDYMALGWNAWKAQKCLPKGTLVHLENGLKPIEDIQIGDTVQTAKGKGKIINKWIQGKQNTITLNTDFGKLECTKNHKVAVFNNDLLSWEFKKAKEINIGDRIVFDATGYDGIKTNLPYDNKIKIPELNEALAWLIGEIHGDGNVQIPGKLITTKSRNNPKPQNGYIKLRIEKDRPLLSIALQKAINGLNSFNKNSASYSEYDTFVVTLYSNDVANYFHEHIKQSNNKLIIPKWIISASKTIRASYLCGLFDADGSCKTRPINLLTTIYKDFAYQVKALYASLGIATCVILKNPHKQYKQQYCVILKGYENIEKFNRLASLYSTKYIHKKQVRTSKNTHSFTIDKIRSYFGGWDGENKDLATYRITKKKGINFKGLPIEVKSINNGRLIETYDIEVENLKQFTANGFIVHNSAQEMYDRMFKMKFLPPGRGLWAMGSEITEERNLYTALFNCAFVSTDNIREERAKPFCFLMDMLMVGCGVGFDVRGAGKIDVRGFDANRNAETYVIPDSREGWVESVKLLLESYFLGLPHVMFDYSSIRPAGEPIKGFGGTASGQDPLIKLHDRIRLTLGDLIGQPLTEAAIVDLMNQIGCCVVAGNVRRSSEIALGYYNDDFIDLKNYKVNPYREDWGWASNNSVIAKVGQDYTDIAERIANNGEPGLFWIDNARQYGRMNGDNNWRDKRIMGLNPCQPDWATVLTPYGIKQIKDINIGDEIWSGKQWTKVTNKWCTGTNDVYAYKTNAGIFYGTDHHRIVSNGEKVKVKDADSIDVAVGETDCRTYHNQDIMDGLVIGDGSVHKASNNLVGLHIGNDDQDYFDSEISNLITGYRPSIKDTFYTIQTTVTYSELPYTYQRSVPERFKYGQTIKKNSFLRGLYSANGSICGNRVTLKSASIELIRDVQIMLSSLGIVSYITTNKSKDVVFNNGTYECKESYDLNISTDRDKFFKFIGFIQKYKQDKLKKLSEKINKGIQKTNYEITEVEYISTENVWDITVEADEHTYWTGGLLVSNCGEITLESYELCNLVETFPDKHDDLDDFLRTLKYAYLYSKTITLTRSHWEETNRVMLRNRRVGCSISGIARFLAKRSIDDFKIWLQNGYKTVQYYDETYSDWLAIKESIKTTTIKPSGTISLVAAETPGMHYPESRFYIRRVRMSKFAPILPAVKRAGYKVEDDAYSDNTVVIEVPVDMGEGVKTINDVSMWEQMHLAALIQRYWSDNAVSCTVTVKEKEFDQIAPALDFFQYQLKAISLLPKKEKETTYVQMPYEAIDEKSYKDIVKKIKKINFKDLTPEFHDETAEPAFCDSEKCDVPKK